MHRVVESITVALTLTVATEATVRFTLRAVDGSTDTLRTANDSTRFEERDSGSWVFSAGKRGVVVAFRC